MSIFDTNNFICLTVFLERRRLQVQEGEARSKKRAASVAGA